MISETGTGRAWLFLQIQGRAESVGTSVRADGAGCGRLGRSVGIIHDVGWARTTEERVLGVRGGWSFR